MTVGKSLDPCASLLCLHVLGLIIALSCGAMVRVNEKMCALSPEQAQEFKKKNSLISLLLPFFHSFHSLSFLLLKLTFLGLNLHLSLSSMLGDPHSQLVCRLPKVVKNNIV